VSATHSPWNALTEALHSALIDELNERFPREKPILGMPRRANGFSEPSDGLTAILGVNVTLPDVGKGVALLAIEARSGNGGGVGALADEEVWAAILRRAQPDFARRGITPSFGFPRIAAHFSAELNKPRLLVWFPFELTHGLVFLGLGVS
jgi:hypothetical protein